MTIIDGLLGEHAAIYRLFERLEQDLATMTDPVEIRARLVALAGVLAPHADAEDELLFAAVAALPGETPDLLAEMEAEHVRVKAAFAGLIADPDVAQVKAILPELLAAARAHFLKEESRGFPLAASLLSAAKLAELTKLWAARRGVLIA